MSESVPPPTWPADVIHVNEDGWVLINRGRARGIAPGLHVFVVGTGTRELRDLFAGAEANADDAPVVLRTRRTYELLEIVHVEEQCAVAVAARAPVARRPRFYRGPEGELLVWVPLPESYTWPQLGDHGTANGEGDEDDADDDSMDNDVTDEVEADGEQDDETSAPNADAPPEHGPQDDERWEQALPLNGVSVGDIVIPAVPIASAPAHPDPRTAGTPPSAAGGEVPGQTTWDKSYDWMHPKTG